MDANGTRYHLFLGRQDWSNCLAEDGRTLAEHWLSSPLASPEVTNESGLVWNESNHEVTLKPRLVEFATSNLDDVLSMARRRGAGRDRYGNWYWIHESGREIRVQSSGTGRSSHFWAAEDGIDCAPERLPGDFAPKEEPSPVTPLSFSGLAVTEDHYLIVGVLEPKGLLVFDLHATGAPRQMLWPSEVDFAPFDMAPRPGGGVWILDREHQRYWALDRKLNVIRLEAAPEDLTVEDFQPLDDPGARRRSRRPFPEGISLELSSPLEARDPIAIDALPDGSVIVLDNVTERGFSRLYRYRLSQQLGEVVSLDAVLEVVEESNRSDFHLTGYDIGFVPAPEPRADLLGKLFVAAMTGNQAYAFDVFGSESDFSVQAVAEYYPMRLFGGKALVTGGGKIHYDFGESWLPLIEQKRPRYEIDAVFFTPLAGDVVLDGKQPDCVWHRLMLDACIPPEGTVVVASRTANELGLLQYAPWCSEPPLHRRAEGTEIPFVPKPKAADAGTWELLFQRAKGRFLQLRIAMMGRGRSTPRLYALRAYYPRFSYLEHYLPAVYRDDEGSAWFLDRFLANEEGTLTTLEDKIANVQMLFDVRSAPPGVLEWLAGWFGIVLDPAWDERRRRLFIKHAMELFQFRGTIRGLLIVLHLGLDLYMNETIFTRRLESSRYEEDNPQSLPSPFRIIEDYRTRKMPPVVLGDPTAATGPRLVTVSQRWTPLQGRELLNDRWQEAIASTVETPFPIRDPGDEHSTTWHSFARTVLGFLPSSDRSQHQELWQAYLSNRYLTIAALNTAYGLAGAASYGSFEEVPLPESLPLNSAQLVDWYEFEGTILPMHRTAHRFVVLLPSSTTLTEQQRLERLEIAQRVIQLEKPAHTSFQVKFYWAMFRLGEARLGADTLIDVGSRYRAQDLVRPFVLDRDYLSEGYLYPSHPQNVADRIVLDRERLRKDDDDVHHL